MRDSGTGCLGVGKDLRDPFALSGVDHQYSHVTNPYP
jgi:hypothetical protein